MRLHEYHARALLREYEIPVSRGEAAFSPEEARSLFGRFASPACIAKVQVLAGGRGKAGGVQRLETADEAEAFARKFIGRPFSTYQSGGEAKPVKAVLITENIHFRSEFYAGVVLDRAKGRPAFLFLKEGGVEIEEAVKKDPRAVRRIHFHPDAPPASELIFSVIEKDFETKDVPRQIAGFAARLAKLFVEKDASICEINPLALSGEGRVVALDAKVVLDDNALYRHPELERLRDPDEEDEREKEAKTFGLSYVSMKGNVGCLVNGAGLAMATMDMIQMAGGEPANFLDVGGGATSDQVREGFKIILKDKRVKSVLVNIFGGIMKCDVIAEGVVEAAREIGLRVPLVVRLEGTRVEEGRGFLKKSALKILACATIQEAAETAVREAARYEKTHAYTG